MRLPSNFYSFCPFRYETTQNREEMICCRTEGCLTTSPRVIKLLDHDVVQVLLAAREYDEQDHSLPTAANCRQVHLYRKKSMWFRNAAGKDPGYKLKVLSILINMKTQMG
jgi:hypothetical protein